LFELMALTTETHLITKLDPAQINSASRRCHKKVFQPQAAAARVFSAQIQGSTTTEEE